jgi:hypothetical protein
MKKLFDFSKMLDLLIKINVYLAIFLPPIFFAFFVKTNNVFELPKFVLFKVLIILLLYFSLVKLSFHYDLKYKFLMDKIKKNKLLFLAIFLYFLSLLISTFISPYFNESMWGSYSRQMGLETYFFTFLFLVLIIFNFKK